MRESTSVQADVVLLTVIIGVLLLVGLAAVAAACWRAAGRPMLPVEDRAPHGLDRFVPVGGRRSTRSSAVVSWRSSSGWWCITRAAPDPVGGQ